MKIANFRNSLIAVAIVLFAVSCGGGGNKQAAGKKTDVEAAKDLAAKAEDKSVTADNWQKVVKKEFGVDLAVPDGWKFSQVKALSFSETNILLMISFEKAGDNAAKVSETARALFDRTKALSTEGIFLIDVNNNSTSLAKGETFETFDDRFTPSLMHDDVDKIDTYWYYKDAVGIKLVDVSAKNGNLRVKLEFDKAIKL
jgi:hypothetical protein